MFDAATKFDEVSLNDELLTGPNSLVGILMRFRSGKIGVMDVEQMFHQVYVCEEDRDSAFLETYMSQRDQTSIR